MGCHCKAGSTEPLRGAGLPGMPGKGPQSGMTKRSEEGQVLSVAGFGEDILLEGLNSVSGTGFPGVTLVACAVAKAAERENRLRQVLRHVDIPCHNQQTLA